MFRWPALLNIFVILPFLVLLTTLLVVLAGREQKNMENKHNAKYAFYYLLSLAALIFTALSVGLVAFNIIDKTVADAAMNYRSVGDGALKFAISALIIAAPIFYTLSMLINRGIKNGELSQDSSLRRWLTYFILLASSLIILGSFIGVINNFLSGELTVRFALKTLAVIIISGTTFSYYLYEVKRSLASQKDVVVKAFFWSSLVVVVISFVAAWFFVESPMTARQRRLDDALMNNIRLMENAINEYYNRNNQLPATWDDVKSSNIYFNDESAADPESGALIEYKFLSEGSYELCATFRLGSRQEGYPGYYIGDLKQHDAGYQCLPGEIYVLDAKGRSF